MAGKRRRSARLISGAIGTVVVILSIVLSLFALNSSAGVPGVPHTLVTMKFEDTGDIHVNGDLREADFRVGRVNVVEYRGDGLGTIEAQFDDQRPVYRNATAQIVSRSGLGQKYVNIQRGTPDAGLLEQNGTIPVTQTQSTAEILSLAGIFDQKTKLATQSAVEQLGAGLAGNGDALSQAVNAVPINLPRLGTVANALNNNNGRDVNLLLASLRDITARFEGRRQTLANLNSQLATTFDAVNADNGQALANVLQTAPAALPVVRRALIDVQPALESTTAALVNLRPGVRDLARATPDVRGVLREAPEPLRKVPGVVDVGNPAVEALTPALRDLRPLVPKLRFAFETARVPLRCLAANASDIGAFFTKFALPLRQSDASRGNVARFYLTINNQSAALPVPLPPQLPFGLGIGQTREIPCPAPDGRGFATTRVNPVLVPNGGNQ